MAPKVLRCNCLRCNASFNTYDPTMIYCNTECKWKHAYEIQKGTDKVLEPKNCLWCGKSISSFSTRNYCDKWCSAKAAHAPIKAQSIKESLTKQKKKKHNLSYAELIRRDEYNRLYDKFHINRIIRGKS